MRKNQVKASVKVPKGTNWISQKNQLGTGHAVKQALSSLRPGAMTLIMYGDVPIGWSFNFEQIDFFKK